MSLDHMFKDFVFGQEVPIELLRGKTAVPLDSLVEVPEGEWMHYLKMQPTGDTYRLLYQTSVYLQKRYEGRT